MPGSRGCRPLWTGTTNILVQVSNGDKHTFMSPSYPMYILTYCIWLVAGTFKCVILINTCLQPPVDHNNRSIHYIVWQVWIMSSVAQSVEEHSSDGEKAKQNIEAVHWALQNFHNFITLHFLWPCETERSYNSLFSHNNTIIHVWHWHVWIIICGYRIGTVKLNSFMLFCS